MLTVGLLVFIALLLGVQLGMRFEQRQLDSRIWELEDQFSGGTGSGTTITDPEEQVDPALLWTVWRLMLKHYINPSDLQVQPMLYGAVRGMVEAVGDPYSVFMTPVENEDFRESLNGKLEGIGAELTLRDGQIIVVAPLKGSPAQKAGLMPEDVIISVDGNELKNPTLQDTVKLIRGPKGSQVKLGVLREGEQKVLEFTITRDNITVPSTEFEVKETASGSIGYISVNQFAENTNQEVQKALESVEEEPDLVGLIIDLRFNGGGYLERAVDLASMFLKQGKVVTVARRGTEPESHYVYGRPIDTDTPLVVLINEGSASASEILAGALQDHKRATIIGKTSFGKGTVQEIFELPGGSSLRVTVAKWLTPNGIDLGKAGVVPDVVVERTLEDFDANEDPQLDAAIEWLVTGKYNAPVTTEE